MQEQAQTQYRPIFGLQEIDDSVDQTERQLTDAEACVLEAEKTAKQARTDRDCVRAGSAFSGLRSRSCCGRP